ncbi:MAG: DUF2156 domain-containing protein [Anaerolineae bacterium]
MRIEPISLEHRTLLSSKLEALDSCFSECTFANVYLTRREHEHHLVFDEDKIWIRGKTRDNVTYLMPTVDLRLFSKEELLSKLNWADCFYPIPKSWKEAFDEDVFSINYNRNDSDYLFKRTKIAEYPGRNLAPKRNLLKQFLKGYSATVVPYSKNGYQDALAILDEWQSAFKDEETDYLPCRDGLEYAQELGLIGYLVYVEERAAALILGEISHTRIFIIHFAKALTQYKGIYPYLFKELASRISSQEICCLNWEQDLGNEGLRQSKLSYQPDKIAHKLRVFKRL